MLWPRDQNLLSVCPCNEIGKRLEVLPAVITVTRLPFRSPLSSIRNQSNIARGADKPTTAIVLKRKSEKDDEPKVLRQGRDWCRLCYSQQDQ